MKTQMSGMKGVGSLVERDPKELVHERILKNFSGVGRGWLF